jgi:homoserine O-acetyltransferase/O-succinyltransferase
MLLQKQSMSFPSFRLENGTVLTGVNIGYETYGQLNAAGDNCVLITHYFSGTSHAAGRYRESDLQAGYWDAIIGPGKAIDTNRYFVLSSDTLCNLQARSPDVVTTGPASIDPSTGSPYGERFPVVTMGDFVPLQKQLCESLGVRHLHTVAGPSMGSMQAMEWTARFPDFVDRALCVVPSDLAADPYLIAMLSLWCAPILLSPDPAGLLQSIKLITLVARHHDIVRRTFGRKLADAVKDPGLSLENRYWADIGLEEEARSRAHYCDGNSLLRLARAVQMFSITERKDRLRARYLFMPAKSDLLMPPSYAQGAVTQLRELGLTADYFELAGDGGHLDGLHNMEQASEVIRKFLA